MTTKNISTRHTRRCRCTVAAALTVVIFVAAAAMTASVLILHGENQLSSYDSLYASKYLASFGFYENATLSNVKRFNRTSKNTTIATDHECFSLNSASWLNSPRIRNAPFESDSAALDLILNTNIHSTLEQTLCHDDSLFPDWNYIDKYDNSSLHMAALRLIYLAFYVHQHEPAWNEARHRQLHCSEQDFQRYNLSNMDYECPDAKFLVVPLGEAGLGAVMRLTVVNALLAGMATQRVVMFVNNANVGPPNIREPWPHASCERHDMQCFFQAPTPCALTEDELKNAHVLERSEMRSMFRNGELSGLHANDRVVISKIHTRPHMAPPNLRENLVAIAKEHIVSNEHDNTALLERAADLIHEIEPLEESRYYYFGHSSKVHHGAVFYAMRPRPEYARLLNEIIKDSLPSEFNPDASLGLPIRGSDKCTIESECLTFEQHMNAAASVWKKHHGNTSDKSAINVIVTTEDEGVINDMKNFSSSNQALFHFITNKQDALQGTGVAKDYNGKNTTADAVMLSSVAALKLQLATKFSIGNCCSNFHNLLFDFVRDGCGSARNAVAICLQEMPEPEFRVCCSWDKSDECTARRTNTTLVETNR